MNIKENLDQWSDEKNESMITINSISGGQTSAYMMKHFPADFNLFALVRINAPKAAPKDPWIRKYVESKTQAEFVATAEDDAIFYTLNDLEQFTGQEITWVDNPSFDDVMNTNGLLPSALRRFCTAEMKVKPIAQWVVDNIREPVEMGLGFRGGEERRVNRAIEAHDECGFRTEKLPIGKHKNGNTKWHTFTYAKNTFPLFDAGIFKDTIVEYWKDKPVRFAERNNCVACFHRNPILLNLMSRQFPDKYQWFVDHEERGRNKVAKNGRTLSWNTYRRDGLYKDFREFKTQLSMEDLDGFTDCDSGYCGL